MIRTLPVSLDLLQMRSLSVSLDLLQIRSLSGSLDLLQIMTLLVCETGRIQIYKESSEKG
jgi:hypothetical protein